MFGALNRIIGRLDAGNEERNSSSNAAGFQVLRNVNPEVPLEPWFDFVIGINGRTIDNPDPNLFATEVRNCAGSTISLGVYSAKGQKIREIFLPIPAEKPTLGLSLQWTPLSVVEDVWHILDVIPNSPADVAGLLPYGDYIIGSPEGLVRGESGLVELVEDHLDRPLRLYVYNHEYNVTRPLTITPSRSWGGEGALGCVLGFGALHRIPAPLEEPPHAPGETLFASSAPHSQPTSFDENGPLPGSDIASPVPAPLAGASPSLFIPANLSLPSKSPPPVMHTPPPAGSAPPKVRKAKTHHAPPPMVGGGLNDYFAEGEAKSREEDYAPKSKSPVPPPPKIGRPPMGGPPRGGPPKGGIQKSGTPVQGQEEDGDAGGQVEGA
ncbi:hypothetical protein GQ43DRAFT_449152 [Delitschia confertaspora ATCC 74209]|uniref:PDZ GRASP-type domain-containing protein n=1 Tax=Delitschia confertaspora ATCC 74209 TaxID=1513339 RepID=A0A9P4JKC7_9PLEO|nr:hypothetical protein GQ43DRAFT_449152 [Delitschia confertaspora ATCC 74209]